MCVRHHVGLPVHTSSCVATMCPSFVVPFARYELGVATKDARMLNRARDYKNDFNFKIRLHARVHLALDDLARRSKGGQ